MTIDYNFKNQGKANFSKKVDLVEGKNKQLAFDIEQFEFITQNMNDIVFVLDKNLIYQYISPSVLRLRGYSPDEIIGKSFYDFVADDSVFNLEKCGLEWESFEKKYGLNSLNGKSLELEIQHKDLSYHWIEVNVFLKRDENGNPTFINGVSRNIDERKKLERELKENENRFRNMVDMLPVVIFELDNELNITFSNKIGKTIFGITDEEITNKPEFLSLFRTDDVKKYFILEKQVLPSSGLTINMITKTGEEIFALLKCKKIIRNNIKSGFRILIINLSEIKENERTIKNLENQVLYAQKLESVGIMAGGLAHDLNNLLVPVIGNSDYIKSSLPQDSPLIENIDRIRKAALRASDLTTQMLEYSGKSIHQIEHININEIISELKDILEISISKIIKFKFIAEKSLPTIKGDINQVRQIILNLITNASEAIDNRKGVISIKTAKISKVDNQAGAFLIDFSKANTNGFVKITVTDNGCGISKNDIDKIFDPFFTTKFAGRGLGMAAVLGIIKSLSGVIQIYSQPGEGTSIQIFIPATKRISNFENKKSDEYHQINLSGKIMIIDDDEDVRHVLKIILEKKGFSIITVSDGTTALEILNNSVNDIDLVLLDLIMPDISGDEIVCSIKSIIKDIPVILMSGYSESDEINNTNLDFDAFLQKPFQTKQLLKTIDSVLINK